MNERTPLQLAANALTNIFGFPNPVDRHIGDFHCGFASPVFGEKQEYEMYVDWQPKKLHIRLQLTAPFDLSRVLQDDRFYALLGSSVEPFLETGESSPNWALHLVRRHDGAMSPSYEAIVDYAPLEDSEIEPHFQSAMLLGLYMFELLSPAFAQAEQGHVPSCENNLKHMYTISGLWEMDVAPDIRNQTLLPHKLYTGPVSQSPN